MVFIFSSLQKIYIQEKIIYTPQLVTIWTNPTIKMNEDTVHCCQCGNDDSLLKKVIETTLLVFIVHDFWKSTRVEDRERWGSAYYCNTVEAYVFTNSGYSENAIDFQEQQLFWFHNNYNSVSFQLLNCNVDPKNRLKLNQTLHFDDKQVTVWYQMLNYPFKYQMCDRFQIVVICLV